LHKPYEMFSILTFTAHFVLCRAEYYCINLVLCKSINMCYMTLRYADLRSKCEEAFWLGGRLTT